MRLDTYQNEAVKLAVYPGELSYPTLGLCGETGELLEAVSVNSRLNVLKEIGDILWYIANVANDAGLKLSEVCDRVSSVA
jgi:NTP pyrophosphatase (non-canonical NTP hydrolase)